MIDALIAFPLGYFIGLMDLFGNSTVLSNMSSFFATMTASFCAMVFRDIIGPDICT